MEFNEGSSNCLRLMTLVVLMHPMQLMHKIDHLSRSLCICFGAATTVSTFPLNLADYIKPSKYLKPNLKIRKGNVLSRYSDDSLELADDLVTLTLKGPKSIQQI